MLGDDDAVVFALDLIDHLGEVVLDVSQSHRATHRHSHKCSHFVADDKTLIGPLNAHADKVAPRRVSSLARVSSKPDRRAARDAVAEYHQARLAELVQRVGDAVDRFRAGELEAFDVDQVIFQYSRAAKELWKFCNLPDAEFTAGLISGSAPVDWWERGALRRR